MTEKRLEKMARAIEATGLVSQQAAFVDGRSKSVAIARAALLAIREPGFGVPFTNEVVDTDSGWQTPRTVWRDTIDAILSGEA